MPNKNSYELTEAVSILVAQHPFFASFLYDLLDLKETDDPAIPTAATDGKNILINTDWFKNKLDVKERVFVLCHEILHNVMSHMSRTKGYMDRGLGPDMKPFSASKMNKAQDYVINATLVHDSIGTMPLDGLFHPDIKWDDLTDEIYCKLPDDPPGGGGNGHGKQGPGTGKGFDAHQPPAPNAPNQSQVERATAASAQAAKAMGNLPSGIERLVGEILNPKQDWAALLRDCMTETIGHDQASWAKPNRRRLVMPPHMIWPGTTGFATEEVAVVVDTSGSISQKELSAFMTEISGILSDTRPERTIVLWVDAAVQRIDELNYPEDLMAIKDAPGGGGTDMTVAFPAIEEAGYNPATVVILTDGYTPYGDEPIYNTIWVSTSDKESPYGRTIKMDL